MDRRWSFNSSYRNAGTRSRISAWVLTWVRGNFGCKQTSITKLGRVVCSSVVIALVQMNTPFPSALDNTKSVFWQRVQAFPNHGFFDWEFILFCYRRDLFDQFSPLEEGEQVVELNEDEPSTKKIEREDQMSTEQDQAERNEPPKPFIPNLIVEWLTWIFILCSEGMHRYTA